MKKVLLVLAVAALALSGSSPVESSPEVAAEVSVPVGLIPVSSRGGLCNSPIVVGAREFSEYAASPYARPNCRSM